MIRDISPKLYGRILTENVRRHAFGLFESCGPTFGADLQNWFDAEREVVWSPTSEVVEKHGEYRARIACLVFNQEIFRLWRRQIKNFPVRGRGGDDS